MEVNENILTQDIMEENKMSKMTEENIVNNMVYLVQELQKEWNESGEMKTTLIASADKVSKIKTQIAIMIEENAQILKQSDYGMTFRESMKISKENYILLRLAKKVHKSMITTTGNDEAVEFSVALDKEEYKLFKQLYICKDKE